MKALIVEDEIPSLRGLKQKLIELDMGIEVVGEAFNGEAALELIPKLNPDVVFTDVRMPIMDGIELIRNIREKYPNIISIIVSGYSDFEYAHEAIKMNVEEYLLKPVDPAALRDILLICLKKLKTQTEENQRKIIHHTILGYPNKSKCGQNHDKFYVAYLCFGNIIQLNSGFDSISEELCSLDIEAYIKDTWQEVEEVFLIESNYINEKHIVIKMSRNQRIRIQEFVEKLYNAIREPYSCPVTLVYSQLLYNVNEIGETARALRIKAKDNIVFCKSSLMELRATRAKSSYMHMLTYDMLNKLLIMIQNNQLHLFKKEVKNIFQVWEKDDYPLTLVEKEFFSILITLKGVYMSDMDLREFEKLFDIENLVTISNDYNELYLNFCFLLDDIFFSNMNDSRTKKSIQQQIIDEVDIFLKSNICRQVSLQEISEKFGMSQVYMCRMFKEVKNVSPIDYFINLKIEKAKEYISLYPEMKFKNIASMVGYNNPYYFSKIFKCIEGLTPSEYKAKALNKND